MKKSDLKSGMLLALRKNREEYFVKIEDLVHHKEDGYFKLEMYKEDLTHNLDRDYDIVEVWDSKLESNRIDSLFVPSTLLWSRKSVAELEEEILSLAESVHNDIERHKLLEKELLSTKERINNNIEKNKLLISQANNLLGFPRY